MNERCKVATIGIWHLGAVTSACFAAYGHSVVGRDPNAIVIANLNKGAPPIYEPGLAETVKVASNKSKLSFTTDFKSGLADSDYVAVTFDTPINKDDTPDIRPILNSSSKAPLPIRLSKCIAFATLGQSTPKLSQKFPSSFEKLTSHAKKAFIACFTISAVLRFTFSTGQVTNP